MKRVLSGIQPTGELHIGNYFGAIKKWVSLQESYECFYLIVDYHAITVDFEPGELRRNTLKMAGDLLACGIDARKSALFVQSHMPEHAELCWILNCFTSFGELTRMTQFKSKKGKQDFVSVGLFNYPVLQAADILLYKPDAVPVGEDQIQHLELTNIVARRFNSRLHTPFFHEVSPILSPSPRIMSLMEPTQKMSKSLGPRHYVGIMESPEIIFQKIRSAVTDVGPESHRGMSPGVKNLFEILKACAPPEVVQEFSSAYRKKNLKYEELKRTLYEYLMKELKPIQESRANFSDENIQKILQEGAERARTIAVQTIQEVRSLIGVR